MTHIIKDIVIKRTWWWCWGVLYNLKTITIITTTTNKLKLLHVLSYVKFIDKFDHCSYPSSVSTSIVDGVNKTGISRHHRSNIELIFTRAEYTDDASK